MLTEMVKAVPPAIAYRRGEQQSQNPDGASHAQLMRRGARQVCRSSLNNAGFIESATRHGEWMVRLRAEYSRQRSPRLVVLQPAKGRSDATHILVPISCYRAVAAKCAEIVFVRETF